MGWRLQAGLHLEAKAGIARGQAKICPFFSSSPPRHPLFFSFPPADQPIITRAKSRGGSHTAALGNSEDDTRNIPSRAAPWVSFANAFPADRQQGRPMEPPNSHLRNLKPARPGARTSVRLPCPVGAWNQPHGSSPRPLASQASSRTPQQRVSHARFSSGVLRHQPSRHVPLRFPPRLPPLRRPRDGMESWMGSDVSVNRGARDGEV